MLICYIDEAGCTGQLPSPHSSVQPVFAIAGLIVGAKTVPDITRDLTAIKRRFYPKALPPGGKYHDWMMVEVKGSELRRMARSTARNERRFAYGVVKEVLDILSDYGVRVLGRVYVKPIGGPFDGTSVYSSSVQRICTDFQHCLNASDTQGLVIADSRNKAKNSNVSHSVCTQMFSAAGNPYRNLVEAPTFGHSDNHAGLQLADVVCSGLLFPIAAELCCLRHMVDHTHCHQQHQTLRSRYGQHLRGLQYRYSSSSRAGGVTLSDPLNDYRADALFA